MSTICHGFIENAWRKDLCSNCFRTKEEHLALAAASKMYQSSYAQNNWRNSHVTGGLGSSTNISNTGNNNSNNSVSINVRHHHQNGLPPPPTQYQHQTNNNYQQNLTTNYQQQQSSTNYQQISGIPRGTGKYTNGSTSTTQNSRSSLYSCYETPNRERVNVVVNNSNSNNGGNSARRPQGVRGSYFDDHNSLANNKLNGNTNNSNGSGGVSVSVGRSSSYNHINTVGRTTASGLINQSPSTNGTTTNYHNYSSGNNNNNNGSGGGLSHHRRVGMTNTSVNSARASSVVTSSTGMNGTVAVVTNGNNSNGNGHGQTAPVPSARIQCSPSTGKTATPQIQNQMHVSSGNTTTTVPVALAPQNNRGNGGKMTDLPDGEVQVVRRASVPLEKAGKSILRKERVRKRKMSVNFPKEVVAVIGYGGESSEDESDEDIVPDPLDSATVSEIMARNSQTAQEKEVNRQTLRNTSFNSIKNNLLGYAPVIIGPIVGGTGGKSLTGQSGSKPLVSIGTFEARTEPLRIRKMGDDTPNPTSNSKNTIAPISRSVTNNSTKSVSTTHKTETKNKVSNVLKANNTNITSQGVTVSVSSQKSTTQAGNSGSIINNNNQEKAAVKMIQQQNKEFNPSCQLPPLPSPRSSVVSSASATNKETVTESEKSQSQSQSLSNLIILNDGNIASKRISFLKEILKEETQSEESSSTTALQFQLHQPLDSLEPCSQVNNPPLILKSEVSLEIQATPVDGDGFEGEFARNNDMFDDSLEDSGLDIKIKSSIGETRISSTSSTEASESDDTSDKSGSNSDSGNENDFSERELLSPPKPKGRTTAPVGQQEGLLRIACDLHTQDINTKSSVMSTAKLSPDSVIYSSEVSEMSTSGSSESIPNRLSQEIAAESVQPPTPSPISTPAPIPIQKTGPTIPPILKRLAPPPPRQAAPPPLPLQAPPAITPRQSVYSNEEIYDDVNATARQDENNRRQSTNSNSPSSHETSVEEDLYDDCAAVAVQGQGQVSSSAAKTVTGSYDFTDTNAQEGQDDERLPVRQNDGIEFIGIRKIDSESFLRQKTPPPLASPTKEKSSSPKVKRKVNQFFSTIGKRAGAAFNRNHNQIEAPGKSSAEKSSPTTSSSFSPFSYYKRSMSQDEMSMTRTQGIYATLSPNLLKARGGTGVLNKLSKIDLSYGSGSKDEDSKEKIAKNRSKFSTSLKKFLRFGPKDGENKYEFETANTNATADVTTTDSANNSPVQPAKTDFQPDTSEYRRMPMPVPDPPGERVTSTSGQSDAWKQSLPPARPPPPPPRVHSLDLLNTAGDGEFHQKPARPPPPVRSINYGQAPAPPPPNFVSVFNGQQQQDESDYEPEGLSQRPRHGHGHTYNPPNKPRRKASMSRGSSYGDGGAYTANYLETTYNHITSLNFETLKLIASQTPARIRRNSNQLIKFNKTPMRWSQFYVTDVEPVCQGRGYCFYSAFWEDEACILLIQESLSCGIPPLEFDCIETSISFEDIVPKQFVTWEASDYVNTGNGVKVFVSVLPSCTVQKLPGYLSNASVTPSRKYFALLQAMDFWGTEEMSDLLVFHQIPSPSATCDSGALSSKSKIQIPNFGLVYVSSARLKSGSFISQHSSRANFEMALKQMLFGSHPHGHHHQHLLCDNDRHILLRRICGASEEVEAQLRLFVQLKLFGPQAGDLDKILRYRSEKQVTQWMDKERAFCMKDAIERTLQRNSEAISPLRKSFVEFLMISDNCAKAVLDLVVDLNPDL